MPAILTSNASVVAAENFIASIHENDSNLYLGVSRGYDDQAFLQTVHTTTTTGGRTNIRLLRLGTPWRTAGTF